MSRTLSRLALTMTTSLALLAMTALPALAADAATKPDPDANPYLIGSLGELGIAALVGVALGLMAFAMRPSGPAEDDHDH